MAVLSCCNKCEGAYSFNQGIKGKNADLTKLLLVLHKSDSRATIPVLPGLGFDDYESAFMNAPTGLVINGLLKFCSLRFDDIYLTNIFKCLLPGDRQPAKKEYENCLPVLEAQVNDFNPSKIIIFGAKVADRMLKNGYTAIDSGEIHEYLKVPALSLDHPSAPWVRNHFYREKYYFKKALEFIRAKY